MTGTLHIVVAMKPIDGNFSTNAISHGVAGLNVDGCRIDSVVLPSERRTSNSGDSKFFGILGDSGERHNPAGRWPANVVHDGSEGVVGEFPVTTSGNLNGEMAKADNRVYSKAGTTLNRHFMIRKGDSGSASRFFKECKEFEE